MSDKIGLQDAAKILHEIQQQSDDTTRERVAGDGVGPQMARLREWQSQRLARTHADLLADPGYAPAGRFFLNDIYAPRDFSQRDHDVQRMYDFMSKFLPDRALRTLALAIELNDLTNELDEELLHVLVEDRGLSDAITEDLYAEAYRRCDNYARRERQIDMIVEVGYSVNRVVRTRLAGMTLRLARGPAYRAGWHELQDFLESGYDAFKNIRDAEYFLETIRQRETQILDQIYAGDPDPFDVS